MAQLKTLFLLLVMLISGAFFSFRGELRNLYLKLRSPEVETFTLASSTVEEFSAIAESTRKVIAPPPLRALKETPEAVLTRAGVIRLANVQREQDGLISLAENATLNHAAMLKLLDMFRQQYFAHISPLGAGPDTLATEVGYDYIVIGENLALGNFENDRVLVQAWMASPGHRANILNVHYQDIGVAVGQGMFKGKMTWLAVQEFGMPLSACPQPDSTLKTKIEGAENQISGFQHTLEAARNEIGTMSPQDGPVYNQKVDGYNALVAQYNALVDTVKVLISEYNGAVKAFNDCAL